MDDYIIDLHNAGSSGWSAVCRFSWRMCPYRCARACVFNKTMPILHVECAVVLTAFLQRRIGRGGGPISWLPRSTGLTPPSSSSISATTLCGFWLSHTGHSKLFYPLLIPSNFSLSALLGGLLLDFFVWIHERKLCQGSSGSPRCN
jgi:hypothetical protein